MLGYKGNAMVVWCVPGDQVNDVGEILASFPQVSHCYERHVPQGWRFNLFTMIHTPDRASAKALIRTMSDRVGIDDYCVFFTKSELKKEGMAYIKDG
jgi:DNA-binding Lrp family transcriptional regulator